ncbi:MAG: metallophosphoesterase family protein [Bacteroidales bacterium]|nr:metallophosphoesterase family protein [Bacteroidales bacterium]HOY38535.1 metallophosphoesterase family protein [Bacteroidales bacterium]HQP03090.1 metallophosphoesterase family protein [Bacteroidales bacterium]
MLKIGLLSDTHGYVEPAIYEFFSDVDEIWHAGDMGNVSVADTLKSFKPFKGVFGNCDGYDVRIEYPGSLRFVAEGLSVWITHIGGYPGKYDPRVKPEIFLNPPRLFISGHSHILKIMPDKKLSLLHINPGAAGNRGIHKVKTLLRFQIDNATIRELEIMEIKRSNSDG